jgi:hypothetical protein
MIWGDPDFGGAIEEDSIGILICGSLAWLLSAACISLVNNQKRKVESRTQNLIKNGI